MKTNEQIAELLKQKRFDDARHACIERLRDGRIDSQAWASLGESFAQQGHGTMALKCFRRVRLLDPLAKWIDNATTYSEGIRDEFIDLDIVDLLQVPHKTVSALILTRNSSRTIVACLNALKDAVDKIIVVDTGSTDNTIQIAQGFEVNLQHFRWCDDFAAARNYALQFVETDWIIAVDSDEILYDEDVHLVREAAGLFDAMNDEFTLQIVKLNRTSDGTIAPNCESRMFPTNRGLHWIRPIHEQISGRDEDRPVKFYLTNIRFAHDGYDSNFAPTYDKALRNRKLLRQEALKRPNDFATHFLLGRDLLPIAETEEATIHLKKACELGNTEQHLWPAAYSLLTIAYESAGNIEKAEENASETIKLFPDYPDGYFQRARLSMRRLQKEHSQIEQDVRQAKDKASKYIGYGDSDPTIAGWRSDLALADVAGFNGDIRNRWRSLSTALQQKPDIPNGFQVLTAFETDVLMLAKEIEQSRQLKHNQ